MAWGCVDRGRGGGGRAVAGVCVYTWLSYTCRIYHFIFAIFFPLIVDQRCTVVVCALLLLVCGVNIYLDAYVHAYAHYHDEE